MDTYSKYYDAAKKPTCYRASDGNEFFGILEKGVYKILSGTLDLSLELKLLINSSKSAIGIEIVDASSDTFYVRR